MKKRIICLIIMGILVMTGCGEKDKEQVQKKDTEVTKEKKEESIKETDLQMIQRKGHPHYCDDSSLVRECWHDGFSDSRVVDDVSRYNDKTIIVWDGNVIEIYFSHCEDISSVSWEKAIEVAKEYVPDVEKGFQFKESYKVVFEDPDSWEYDTKKYISIYGLNGEYPYCYVIFEENKDGNIESLQIRENISDPLTHPEEHEAHREEWFWNVYQ